ncbi:MAG: glucosaminidase domain-containing protein [Opitutales bacterium]|nr:glucosaminidase domain-containing protein [Opitutales bacterium]
MLLLSFLAGCTSNSTSYRQATLTVPSPTTDSAYRSPKQTARTRIMGQATCTIHQMQQLLLARNPKVSKSYLAYPKIFLEEGAKEGVRGDLAFAQALHETNYFKFGGDVSPRQNNFCGLGTTGNGVAGHQFATPREGIRAQIQHLKAYASYRPLANKCIDPRFQQVQRGCAPNLEDLGGLWAYPGYDTKKYRSLAQAKANKDSYGHKIKQILMAIQSTK